MALNSSAISAMDTSEATEVAKRCFNVKVPVYDKLNVLYNQSTLMLALWNKYHIFLYESMNFESEPITFAPEFVTHNIILSDLFLLCLDSNGNVHIHSLNFNNPAHKRFKATFHPREQSVATFLLPAYPDGHTFCIKVENQTVYLCLHKISVEYQLKSKILLKCDFPISPLHTLQGKCILRTCAIREIDHEFIINIFNITTVERDSVLIIATFNAMAVYGCLFNQRMPEEEIDLVKLYSCPLEIQDIQVLQEESLDILIGLKSGTVVRLSFNTRKPQVIHLNISILKFFGYKDTLIYTDGSAMWKSEKTYTQKDMKLTQLFVKLARDFIIFDNQILCVTYSNLIYLFPVEDETIYVKTLAENEFYAAEKFLEGSTQHDKITTELLKNVELAEKMRIESNYIGAMALANRQDVIKDVIKCKVLLFDTYEEARNEESDLKLTNEMHEYFEPETVLFMIQVTFTEQYKLNDMFVCLLQDLKVHITISSADVFLKTVSVKVDEVLKELKVLTPLRAKDISNVTIKIKLVPGLPGTLDKSQKIWIVLSEEETVLNSEHFIRSTASNRNIINLKNSPRKLENLILEMAKKLHHQVFAFTDVSDTVISYVEWGLYVKLPRDYARLLSRKETYLKHFTKAKSAFLLKTFSSQDFHLGKTQIQLQIGNETARLKIIEDDISGPLLMISSCDIISARHLREFFSEAFYGEYDNYEAGKILIPQAQFAILEDLQRSLNGCLRLTSDALDDERITALNDQFQRNILGSLPM